MRSTLVPAVLLLWMVGSARAEGRFASVGLGGTVGMQVGNDPPSVPALLQHAPELQLAWGLHAGDVLVLTRFNAFGVMMPVGPAGVGLDVGAGWAPGWQRAGWAPLVRGFLGGVAFGSGGEMFGPDHASYGFRFSAEAGVVKRIPVAAGTAAWGVILGAQAIGLVSVDPCSASDDCDTALLGATLRLEAQLTF
jgi:hypothetical protein